MRVPECPHCFRMKEEIETLQRELGVRRRDGELGALMSKFNLTATQARMVHALYTAKRAVSESTLADELPLDGGATAVKAHVHNVRQKIGEAAILTITGIGYQLSPYGWTLAHGALHPRGNGVGPWGLTT
jgi:DNA-binding response OmpR family regulator